MRVNDLPIRLLISTVFIFALLTPALLGQASYQGEIRGIVTDASGAVVSNATVAITENGTNVSQTVKTDRAGAYILRALRPSTYLVKVEAPGFQIIETKNVVLAVGQQASLNFTIRPAGASTKVEVTEAAPLLDTESAALGSDITSQYVKEIPLLNRNFFGLVFLSAGVTETAGSSTADSYPSGTNFVSNGQRNATAEIRIDGALISAPEQGEGGNSNVYYEPSVEVIQEFKVQNNSFTAEFGSNGGTVVNMALKSGTNALHGSAWWFGQRSFLDANDFFSNQAGLARPDHSRNQYGLALGGPVRKDKTFFFIDMERVLETDPVSIVATVPTALERNGDFSQTVIADPNSGNIVPNLIYDPHQVDSNGVRSQFPNNIITQLDPIGAKILNLYPLPNQPGNADGTNNFRRNTNAFSKALQFDAKLDEQFSTNSHIAGRFSHAHASNAVPTVLGDGEFNDGINSTTSVENGSLQFDRTLKPTLLLSGRLAVEYVTAPGFTKYPSASSAGFPSVLDQANQGISRMPAILVDSPWTSLFDQCCVDTKFAHTLYSYSAALEWVHGKHSFKFGGEQRQFFNNFKQVPYPTGYFHFSQDVTENVVGAFDPTQGNPFAAIAIGYGDYGGIAVYPGVANKSKETGFYAQDSWKASSKLTLNYGLRYEWSTPYSERNNLLQYSDFTGNSGVTVPGLPLASGPLLGITRFPTSGHRNIPVDRNNWGPRLGFAYQLTPETVVRGGAGIYYGMNVATNYQYSGTAFRKDGAVYFTQDNFGTQYATLENPFPAGLPAPQGKKYGALANWGFSNQNDLGTTQARNAEEYQWSLGVQRLLPKQIVVSVDYSANRSTHLPWGGAGGICGCGVTTRNRNFIPSAIRRQYNTEALYNQLHSTVANPFQPLFSGPNAIFNEPDSQYNNAQIPLINLLRPYPQFDGPFEGLPLLVASSYYNALQVRFEKRASRYLSITGGYTLAKSTDNSSVGRNAFIGSLASDNPQELDNLKAEHSISANDATHRLAFAMVADSPIGRGRYIGANMNRFVDAVVGGWTISSIMTLQSGQPINIGMSQPTLDDGNQRPDVLCNPSTGLSAHRAALTGLSTLNSNCFAYAGADPVTGIGYEQPGNAPRYFSNLRSDGIHNIDVSFEKSFVPKEGMKLEVRAEFFNFFNTPRFAPPDTLWGDSTFGQISSTLPGSTPRHGQLGIRFEF